MLFQYLDTKIKKYLDMCHYMPVKSFIIFNKMDLVKIDEYNHIVLKFSEYIQNAYSKQVFILDESYTDKNISNNNTQTINVIPFSCVTHLNIDIIKQFLMDSTAFTHLTNINDKNDNKHYLINDCMYIPEIGPVISGTMISGNISVNDELLIGPFGKNFHNVKVQSIHKKQVSSDTIFSGESGSMVVEILDGSDILTSIDKHLSIITPNRLKYFTHKFELVSHDLICEKITTGSQFTIFTMNVIEAALVQNIKKIDDNLWKIVFMFTKPDILRYIYDGSTIIFRRDNDVYFGTCYKFTD